MNDKDFTDILKEIENEYYINDIIYKGFHVWPLIRLFMYMNQHGNMSKHTLTSVRKNYLGKFNINKIWQDYNNRKILKSFKKKVDLLFLSRTVDESRTEEKYYDRYIDPIYEGFNKDFTCLKLQINNSNSNIKHKEITYCLNLPLIFKFKRKLLLAKKIDLKYIYDLCAKYHKPNRYDLSIEWVRTQLVNIEISSIYFESLFKLMQPKVIFMVWYHSPEHMGIIKAA